MEPSLDPDVLQILPPAPIFYPTEEEFTDPIAYFNKIYSAAEIFGICKVIPPKKSWNPPCALNPDSCYFTPRVQLISSLEAKQLEKKCVAQCNDPHLDFGFQDHKMKFDLCTFEDYADEFKRAYFNMEPSKVHERVIEQEFWRHVLNPESKLEVLYGADLHSGDHGSGFPTAPSTKKRRDHQDNVHDTLLDDTEKYVESAWNLNNLPHLRSSILRHIGNNVSGMTRPWVYIGMLFSAFCWHTEDHWTPSINYLHFGDTKTWFGCPGSQAAKFEECLKEHVPTLFKFCPDILHSLNMLIHPKELIKKGVNVCRADQHAGEFIITLPRAYHAGFNQGFNCAEAVNFATSRWLPLGYQSIDHYVLQKRINVFSHEELLCKLATDSSVLDMEAAAEAFSQLKMYVDNQKDLYLQLTRLGIRNRKRFVFENCKNDDERSCFHCSKTLFFSAFTCVCLRIRADQSPKTRQSCQTHFRTLCGCALSKRQFMYRYSIHELERIVAVFADRIEYLKKEAEMKTDSRMET